MEKTKSHKEIILTGLVTEQFVHLDCRRAMGSCGGKHERVEDKDFARLG